MVKSSIETDERESGIIRVPHDRTKPYVTLSRGFLQDSRLSFAARGVLGYLLSKSEDWQLRVSDLIAQSDAGRDAIRAILRNLEECGYLRRTKERTSDGRFRWISEVFEAGDAGATRADEPSTDDVPPTAGLPSPVEPSIYESKEHEIKEPDRSEARANETDGSIGADRSVFPRLRTMGFGESQATVIARVGIMPDDLDRLERWIAGHQHGEDGVRNPCAVAYAKLRQGLLPFESGGDADELAAEAKLRASQRTTPASVPPAAPPSPPPPAVPPAPVVAPTRPPAQPEPEYVDWREFARVMGSRGVKGMSDGHKSANPYQTAGPGR